MARRGFPPSAARPGTDSPAGKPIPAPDSPKRPFGFRYEANRLGGFGFRRLSGGILPPGDGMNDAPGARLPGPGLTKRNGRRSPRTRRTRRDAPEPDDYAEDGSAGRWTRGDGVLPVGVGKDTEARKRAGRMDAAEMTDARVSALRGAAGLTARRGPRV